MRSTAQHRGDGRQVPPRAAVVAAGFDRAHEP